MPHCLCGNLVNVRGRTVQKACRPGSVPPVSGRRRPFVWDVRCRTPRATNPSGDAEDAGRDGAPRPAAPIRSCSRWGLPCRLRRRNRGALLPPRFTLTGRPGAPGGPAVCFLWHFPWGRPRRALPGTVPPWSPDLPHRARGPARPSGLLNRAAIQTFSSSSRKRASSSHSSSRAAISARAPLSSSAACANRSGSRS